MTSDILDIQALRTDPEFEIPRACNISDMSWEGINTALQQASALHTFANVQYQQAKAKSASAAHEYQIAATRAFADMRAAGEAVSAADKLVELDQSVIIKRREQLKADADSSMWYALVKGLEGKMSMLQQISARQREELKAGWRTYNDVQGKSENP